MQLVLPSSDVLPLAQAQHSIEPGELATDPREQVMQSLLPFIVEYLPAGQAVQGDAVESEYVPGGQAAQLKFKPGEKFPFVQVEQALLPIMLLKLPGAQVKQKLEPEMLEKVLDEHEVQESCPGPGYAPG